jgi:uncharacterized protein YebE (UPF0316 family)
MSIMAFFALTNSGIYTWLVLPLLIFMARVFDVSLGTIRIIFVSRGTKYLAPLVGFFELLIWLLAIGQIMRNLSNIACYVAYAGGFATGTYVGMYLEEKLAMGVLLVRIITGKDASELISFLISASFGVTSVDAHGVTGHVNVIYTMINRGDLQRVVGIIRRFNPKAFYSTEDIRSVSKEIFPYRKPLHKRMHLRSLLKQRKGK